jgi:hypothetical protein
MMGYPNLLREFYHGTVGRKHRGRRLCTPCPLLEQAQKVILLNLI